MDRLVACLDLRIHGRAQARTGSELNSVSLVPHCAPFIVSRTLTALLRAHPALFPDAI